MTTERDNRPDVRLGALREGGLAPAIMALIERGVQQRPDQARALRLEVELQLEDIYPPVRILFAEDGVLVEDGPAVAPGLRISGTLPDLAAMMVAPTVGGVPSPINPRGSRRDRAVHVPPRPDSGPRRRVAELRKPDPAVIG